MSFTRAQLRAGLARRATEAAASRVAADAVARGGAGAAGLLAFGCATPEAFRTALGLDDVYRTDAQVRAIVSSMIGGGGTGGSGGTTTPPPAAGAATLALAETNWFGINGSYSFPDQFVSGPAGFAQLARIADNDASNVDPAQRPEHGAQGGITNWLANERRTLALDVQYDEVPGLQYVLNAEGGKYGGGGFNLATTAQDGGTFADGFTIHGLTIAVSPIASSFRRCTIEATSTTLVTSLAVLHRNSPGETRFNGIGGRPLRVVNPVISARLN